MPTSRACRAASTKPNPDGSDTSHHAPPRLPHQNAPYPDFSGPGQPCRACHVLPRLNPPRHAESTQPCSTEPERMHDVLPSRSSSRSALTYLGAPAVSKHPSPILTASTTSHPNTPGQSIAYRACCALTSYDEPYTDKSCQDARNIPSANMAHRTQPSLPYPAVTPRAQPRHIAPSHSGRDNSCQNSPHLSSCDHACHAQHSHDTP